MIRKHFPKVRLIVNHENSGFARANNQALAVAKGSYFCLINPDTLVREDTFQSCLDYMESHADVGMVGCKVLNPDGSLQLACRRSFPTPWVGLTKALGFSALFPKSRLFGRYNLTYLDPEAISEVEAVSGSFMFVRKAVIDQVGLLDEAFFMYGEDLDWCYRIHQAGWKIVYLPTTQIIHYKGCSAKEAPFDNLRTFYSAMQLFVRKHFRTGTRFLPQWFLMLGIWLRAGFGFLSQISQRLAVPLIDFLFLQIGLGLAILIWLKTPEYWSRYLIVNGIYTIIWLGCFWGMGLYRRGRFSSSNAIGAVFFGFVINTSVTFFIPGYQFSRAVMLIAAFLDGLFLGSWRLILRLATRRSRSPLLSRLGRSLVSRRSLIVGTGVASRQIMTQLRRHPETGYEVIGYLSLQDPQNRQENDDSLPLLGNIDDIERIATAHRIHEVIFPAEAVSYERVLDLMAKSKALHLEFKMVPRETDVLIGKSNVDSLDDFTLMDLEYPIYQGWNLLFKRLFDLLSSVILLPLTLIFFLCVLIKPSWKFRKLLISNGFSGALTVFQMIDGEKEMKPFFQIFGLIPFVFLGRLSIVGSEFRPFQPDLPGRGIKPGITGLVQVNRSKKLTEEEKKRYTVYYMRNYSIFLDVEILLKTLF
jgi:GT2 family glycosyltransferase